MASSRSSYAHPPEGCYRKRLCLKCKTDLLVEGYFMRGEEFLPSEGTCERCKKKSAATNIYRYTLSAKERERRGLP